MRSRTSREVPEWSGGEELYIGSPVSATGKVSGVIGIVPGPPEGSRGSTGWGHLSRRAPWAESGGEPAPNGLGRHFGPPPHAPRVGNPRGGSFPLPWGARQPLPPWPPPPLGDPISKGCAPPLGAYIKGGEGGQHTTAFGASLLPCNTSLSRAEARRSPAGEPLHPPPRRRAVGSPSTSPPPLLDQERRRRRCTVRVLNAEVPSVRHSVIGDLDHGEYDSVIHVHWNASARDLQGYVDALLSPRC